MRAAANPHRVSGPGRMTHPFIVLVCAASLGACGGLGSGSGDGSSPRPERDGNAIVFRAASFEGRPDMLRVLSSRISSMRVTREGACPAVIFRGRSSMQGTSSARVYVNGQEAVNTCVLEMVSTWDVDRVEVYPSGIVRRPGYPVSGTGSILVFTKDAGGPIAADTQ